MRTSLSLTLFRPQMKKSSRVEPRALMDAAFFPCVRDYFGVAYPARRFPPSVL